MRYLCLVYQDVVRTGVGTWDGQEGFLAEALAFRDELRESEHGLVIGAVNREAGATIVAVRHGGLAIGDEPPVSQQGQLTEFALIEAADLNEAIRWVAKMPAARVGHVEIWTVDERQTGTACRDGRGVAAELTG